MSFTSSYVMAGIGTFFILFWLFLYIKYRNAYDRMDGVSSDITVTATAASCDGAEFVRNTDMVYDFVTFLSDRLHISDKISYLKEKVQGVFQEDAKEAANAAG